MFYYAKDFDQILNDWDPSSMTDWEQMTRPPAQVRPFRSRGRDAAVPSQVQGRFHDVLRLVGDHHGHPIGQRGLRLAPDASTRVAPPPPADGVCLYPPPPRDRAAPREFVCV